MSEKFFQGPETATAVTADGSVEVTTELITKENEEKFERIRLAFELIEHKEGFPFRGLEDKAYEALRAVDDEYPGMTTPIGDLIARLEASGMKVAFGDSPISGNIYVMPLDSDNVEMDGIFPRHLKVNESMHPDLQKLILSHREAFEAKKKV